MRPDSNGKDKSVNDRYIAGGVTLVCGALIILLLLFCNMGNIERRLMAEASTPEPEEEELLMLEPELDLSAPGEENQLPEAGEAPLPQGEPDPADEPQPEKPEIVRPGKNEKAAPVTEPVQTQSKPAPANVTENRATTAEEKRLKSMESRFKSPNNGAAQGKNAAVNGNGKVSTAGSLYGRGFNGCTTSRVEVSGRVVVKVNVKVNDEGKVTSAKAVSGPAAYHAVCEKWARSATWTPQKGAPVASGSITFTINPG